MQVLQVSSPDPSTLRQTVIRIFSELPQNSVVKINVQEREANIQFSTQTALQQAQVICSRERKSRSEVYARIIASQPVRQPRFSIQFQDLPVSFQDFDLKQLIEQQTGYSCGEEIYESAWNLREDSLHTAKSITLKCYNKDFCLAC